ACFVCRGSYFFELPFWRLLYGWAIALAAGTLVLTAAVYVLQRSLVLTARGPRLGAGGARPPPRPGRARRGGPRRRAPISSLWARWSSSCVPPASGSTASTSSTRRGAWSSAPP